MSRLKNEADLQYFIADNPWLLNHNYESVPELDGVNLEYQAGDKTRIDLLLRDRVSGSPVIVEFKFGSFNRENIGQLLEYKARVAITFRKENCVLYNVFKERVLAPRLALVVKECNDFSRVACNMAAIDVYEYKNISSIFSDPRGVRTIENFTESMKSDPVPLSQDRNTILEQRVYMPIKQVLREENQENAWQEPRESTGYFFPWFANLFLNRWLFRANPVSMGLSEDIFGTLGVVIEYYSKDQNLLQRFMDEYNGRYRCSLKMAWDENYKEGFLKVIFPRKDFFAEPAQMFKTELKHYLDVLKAVSGGIDN